MEISIKKIGNEKQFFTCQEMGAINNEVANLCFEDSHNPVAS
jgi:hypothetical protein